VVRERCSHCAPEEFAEPFSDPTDKKIYSGPQAFPHLYKRDANDVFQAKDELLADTAALWDGGPTERARRLRQATRRTDPMTAEEIEQSRKWGEEMLAPVLRRGGVAAAAAVFNDSE
jgi:hypothetical protein